LESACNPKTVAMGPDIARCSYVLARVPVMAFSPLGGDNGSLVDAPMLALLPISELGGGRFAAKAG
jgi:hypothetical protein